MAIGGQVRGHDGPPLRRSRRPTSRAVLAAAAGDHAACEELVEAFLASGTTSAQVVGEIPLQPDAAWSEWISYEAIVNRALADRPGTHPLRLRDREPHRTT